jgi:predicted CXXCH cytochrome family protein
MEKHHDGLTREAIAGKTLPYAHWQGHTKEGRLNEEEGAKKALTKKGTNGIYSPENLAQKGGKDMKRWLYLMIAVAFLAGGILSLAVAQPDKITINDKFPNQIKGPVTFDHKAHTSATACTTCHHTWKKEASKTPPKCTDCHKAGEAGPKGLKNAFHKLCMDCHKKLQQEGKKAGPTFKCSDCHASK